VGNRAEKMKEIGAGQPGVLAATNPMRQAWKMVRGGARTQKNTWIVKGISTRRKTHMAVLLNEWKYSTKRGRQPRLEKRGDPWLSPHGISFRGRRRCGPSTHRKIKQLHTQRISCDALRLNRNEVPPVCDGFASSMKVDR